MHHPESLARACLLAAVGVVVLALPLLPASAAPPVDSAPAGSPTTPPATSAASGAAAADPVARARELYGQGVDAMNAKDWARAEGLFEQAWALKQHFTIAGNLGTCEIELEKFAAAAEHLAWAVDAMKAEGGHDAERVALGRQLVKARARAAALHLQVRPPGTTGVTVQIDGRNVGWPSKRTLYLPVGEHQIEVRTPDGRHTGRKFSGEAGVKRELVLDLGTAGSGVSASTGWAPPMWPAYAAVGAGLAVLLIPGVISSVIATAHEDDADALRDQIRAGQASCSPGCPGLIDEYAAADTAHDTTVALLATGFGLVAVAAIWGSWALVAGRSDSSEEETARVRIVPVGPGVALSGEF